MEGATVLAGLDLRLTLGTEGATISDQISSYRLTVANGVYGRRQQIWDDWNLHQDTEVAANLNVITSDTAKQGEGLQKHFAI